jgi:hypothetical protein
VLWDPLVNVYTYTYTYDKIIAAFQTVSFRDLVAWLNFNERWGDDQPA